MQLREAFSGSFTLTGLVPEGDEFNSRGRPPRIARYKLFCSTLSESDCFLTHDPVALPPAIQLHAFSVLKDYVAPVTGASSA